MSFDILQKIKVGVTLLLKSQLSRLTEVHQFAVGNAKQVAGGRLGAVIEALEGSEAAGVGGLVQSHGILRLKCLPLPQNGFSGEEGGVLLHRPR